MKKEDKFGSLATFQFSTSVMLFSEFDSLVGCRTTEYEGYVPTKAYSIALSSVFKASICVMLYGVSTDSLIPILDTRFSPPLNQVVPWVVLYME